MLKAPWVCSDDDRKKFSEYQPRPTGDMSGEGAEGWALLLKTESNVESSTNPDRALPHSFEKSFKKEEPFSK